MCATPVPKDVGLIVSAVMSAGGQWTFWKALPNEDLFQFVVIWIGDAQSTHLLVLWEIRIDRYVVRREKQKQEQVTLTQTTSHGMTGQQVCVCVCVCVCACMLVKMSVPAVEHV